MALEEKQIHIIDGERYEIVSLDNKGDLAHIVFRRLTEVENLRIEVARLRKDLESEKESHNMTRQAYSKAYR